MKILKKYFLPPAMGFAAALVSAGLSLLLFVYLPQGGNDQTFSDSFSLFLTLMMILSSFLTYAAMQFCCKFNSRYLDGDSEEKNGRFIALFLIGSALAAAFAMLMALLIDFSGAESLVMICYMIICNLVVIIAFALLVLFVQWFLSVVGKDGNFLNQLKWQLPLSLFWFAAVFTGLLFF